MKQKSIITCLVILLFSAQSLCAVSVGLLWALNKIENRIHRSYRTNILDLSNLGLTNLDGLTSIYDSFYFANDELPDLDLSGNPDLESFPDVLEGRGIGFIDIRGTGIRVIPKWAENKTFVSEKQSGCSVQQLHESSLLNVIIHHALCTGILDLRGLQVKNCSTGRVRRLSSLSGLTDLILHYFAKRPMPKILIGYNPALTSLESKMSTLRNIPFLDMRGSNIRKIPGWSSRIFSKPGKSSSARDKEKILAATGRGLFCELMTGSSKGKDKAIDDLLAIAENGLHQLRI